MSKQLKFPKVSVARLQVQQERSNAKSKLEEEKTSLGLWLVDQLAQQLEQAHVQLMWLYIGTEYVKGIDNISSAQHFASYRGYCMPCMV